MQRRTRYTIFFLLYLSKLSWKKKFSRETRSSKTRKEIFSPHCGIVVFSNEPVASVRFIYIRVPTSSSARRRIYIKRYPCFTVSLFLQASHSRRIMPAGGHLVAQITPAKRAGTGGFITSIHQPSPPLEFSRLVSIVNPLPHRSILRIFCCRSFLFARAVILSFDLCSIFLLFFFSFSSER